MKNIRLLFCLIVFLVSIITPAHSVFAGNTDLPKYLDVQGNKVISQDGKVCFNITNMIDKPIEVTVTNGFDFSVATFTLPSKGSVSLTFTPHHLEFESSYEVCNFKFDVACVSGREHIDFPVYVVRESEQIKELEAQIKELEEPTQAIGLPIIVLGLSIVFIFIIALLCARASERRKERKTQKKTPIKSFR